MKIFRKYYFSAKKMKILIIILISLLNFINNGKLIKNHEILVIYNYKSI